MRSQATSSLPAVIDALLVTWRAALAGAGDATEVFDGPIGANTPAGGDVVVVGVEPPTAAAEGQQEPHGLGNRLQEDFTVHCRVSSLSGDTDMKARRDRAYAILAILTAVLKTNPTLGGVCDRVFLGRELTLWQGQITDGAVAEVAFDITGSAWL